MSVLWRVLRISHLLCADPPRRGRAVGDSLLFVEQRNAALVGAALGGREGWAVAKFIKV